VILGFGCVVLAFGDSAVYIGETIR
jgi:hypothetical protein